VRKASYILVGLGLLQAIAIKLFDLEDTLWLASFGITMILGTVMLMGSVVSRLANGQLKLRPLQALKRFPLLFAVLAGAMILARFILPPSDKSLTYYLIMAAILAGVFSFQQTAYRKPA